MCIAVLIKTVALGWVVARPKAAEAMVSAIYADKKKWRPWAALV